MILILLAIWIGSLLYFDDCYRATWGDSPYKDINLLVLDDFVEVIALIFLAPLFAILAHDKAKE